ncbi:MAG: TrkA C-terminal domain-containing protein, partial [Finegoldia magna]|nr:TrkA C-terminal domain-containing protein [Finegoldia magna]
FERQLEDKNLLVPNETDLGNYSILEYTIVDGLDVIDKKLKEIKFPRHILIISIERDNKEFVPNAEDKILLGDKITVLLNTEDALEIDEYLKIE